MPINSIPTEQTSAVTDIVLALVALWCSLSMRGIAERDPWKANVWMWAFGALSLAATMGVLAHGFEMSYGLFQRILQVMNLALGQTVALFAVGAIADGWGPVVARRFLPILMAVGLLFFTITLFIDLGFLLFLGYELIAMLFALTIYGRLAFARALPGAGLMAAGVLLSIGAAAIQASGSANLNLIWQFDHNGLFHIVQLPALFCFAAGLRAIFRSQQ